MGKNQIDLNSLLLWHGMGSEVVFFVLLEGTKLGPFIKISAPTIRH